MAICRVYWAKPNLGFIYTLFTCCLASSLQKSCSSPFGSVLFPSPHHTPQLPPMGIYSYPESPHMSDM